MNESIKYHVKYKNQAYKKAAILETEKQCPSCNNANTDYRAEKRGDDLVQNHYKCPICGTEWYGNTYNTGGDIFRESSSAPSIVLAIAAIIVILQVLFNPAWASIVAVICLLTAILSGIQWYKRNLYGRSVRTFKAITLFSIAGCVVFPILAMLIRGFQIMR